MSEGPIRGVRKGTRQRHDMKTSNARPFSPVLIVAALTAATMEAAALLPVRLGGFDNLFGKDNPSAIAAAFARLDEKTAQPFQGAEGLKCTAIYSGEGFSIMVFRTGAKRAVDPGEVGGRIAVQIYHGMNNVQGGPAPILFAYDMSPQTPPPRGGRHESSTYMEEDYARALKSRVFPLLPGYRGYYTRTTLPNSSFGPLSDGWYVKFSFDWIDLFGHIPFEEGKLPMSWRLIANYEAPDGSVSRFGTPESPIILSWARGGDKFVGDMHNALFMSLDLGPAYQKRHGYYSTRFSVYKAERHTGYINPGKPTFEQKNPESDDMFFENCAKPILSRNDKMKDLLYFNGREGVPVPAVFKLEKSFRDEIFSKLERLLYLSHDLDSIRRDYLLARFTERPIPKPRVEVEKAKTEAKPKNKPKGNDELLDEPDTVGDAIELDDIVF